MLWEEDLILIYKNVDKYKYIAKEEKTRSLIFISIVKFFHFMALVKQDDNKRL